MAVKLMQVRCKYRRKQRLRRFVRIEIKPGRSGINRTWPMRGWVTPRYFDASNRASHGGLNAI